MVFAIIPRVDAGRRLLQPRLASDALVNMIGTLNARERLRRGAPLRVPERLPLES